MARDWSAQDILDLGRTFQPACVLSAAAELAVFDALGDQPVSAEAVAAKLHADCRGMTILLDALVAMELLVKREGLYTSASGVADVLTEGGGASALAMIRHQANCLRRWSLLAEIVRTGRPAECKPSIRGEQADLEAFIEAMNEISSRIAPGLVKALGPLQFRHLLDLGGGPGTWTIEFLRTASEAKATLYDRPDVIPIAGKHMVEAGLADRVDLVAGDLMSDEPLPKGADLAWVSAVIHMLSREENRRLFANVHAALADGGRVLVRDVVMDESRTIPPDGALFAVNMLVNTHGGGTYSLEEISEDLASAGFHDPSLIHPGEFMDSVVQAVKS